MYLVVEMLLPKIEIMAKQEHFEILKLQKANDIFQMNGSRGPNTAKSGTFIHFGKVDSVNGCTSATVWEFRECLQKPIC